MSRQRRSTEIAHQRAVERTIAAMRRDLASDLSLKDLSEIALMSPYHFSRVFRRVTGVPPLRFLSALRMDAAKRLLAATDLPIAAICFEVGYSSPGTFSNRFQEAVGVSPRDYRLLSGAEATDSRGALHVLRSMKASATKHEPVDSVLRARLLPFDTARGPVFVGLFRKPVPEGRPVACTVLDRPGDVLIPRASDGRYHLFATTVRWSPAGEPSAPQDRAWVAGLKNNHPVPADAEPGAGLLTLELGPAPPTAPPILMSIRAFLHQAFAQAQVQGNLPLPLYPRTIPSPRKMGV